MNDGVVCYVSLGAKKRRITVGCVELMVCTPSISCIALPRCSCLKRSTVPTDTKVINLSNVSLGRPHLLGVTILCVTVQQLPGCPSAGRVELVVCDGAPDVIGMHDVDGTCSNTR
jgi:hypothetical protein